MTERKPPGVAFESWVERQIRAAEDRGELANLRGAGKPLAHSDRDDELWWLKGYLHREGLSAEALLPESLRLRKDLERLPDTVRALHTEQDVLRAVRDLNRRISAWLHRPTEPWVRVGPVDEATVLTRWRTEKSAARPTPHGQPARAFPSRRRAWWRRITGRLGDSA